ncbi:hypothetical protein [Sutterella sp.]|uniref:hypothetical protein n=1 Tax=Sutterella sp. TaxID=1981025 RepID=UPI003FD8BF73
MKAVAAEGEKAPAHAPAPKSMAEAHRIRMAETAEGYAKLRATLDALQNSSAEPWTESEDALEGEVTDRRNEPDASEEADAQAKRSDSVDSEDSIDQDDLNEEPDAVALDALGGWNAFDTEDDEKNEMDEKSGSNAAPAVKAAGAETNPKKAQKESAGGAAAESVGESKEKKGKKTKQAQTNAGAEKGLTTPTARKTQETPKTPAKRAAEQPVAQASAAAPEGADGLFAGTNAPGGRTPAEGSSGSEPDPFLVPRGPNRRLSTSREALAGALSRSVAASEEADGNPQEPSGAQPLEALETLETVDAAQAPEVPGGHFTRLTGRRVRLPGDVPPRPVRDLIDPEVALSLERISNPGWGGKMMAEGARLWLEENALRKEALLAALSAGPAIPMDEKERLAREAEAAHLYADPAQSGFTGEISARPELWAVFKDDVAGAQTTALRLDCRGLEKRITELARADVADPRIPPLVEHYETLSTRLLELVRVQTKEGEKAAKRVTRLGAAGFAGVSAAPVSGSDPLTELLARLKGGASAHPAAPRVTPTEAWLAALSRRTPADVGAQRAGDSVAARFGSASAEHSERPSGQPDQGRDALLDKLWSVLARHASSGRAPGSCARNAPGAPQTSFVPGPALFEEAGAPNAPNASAASDEPTLFADIGAERPSDRALEEKLKGLARRAPEAMKSSAGTDAADAGNEGDVGNEADKANEGAPSPLSTGAEPPGGSTPSSTCADENRQKATVDSADAPARLSGEAPEEPDAAASETAPKAPKAAGRKRTGGFGFAGLRFISPNRARAAAALLAAAVAAPVLWRTIFPAPAFAVVDRDLVETQVALLRLTHAQPGMPERADLKGLDAAAIDRAVSLTAADAGLPLMDRHAVLSTAGAEPVDLTEAVFERLGVTLADRTALADALAHGWSADVNLALERAKNPNVRAPQGVAEGAAERNTSRAAGGRLLAEASRVESDPPVPDADEDFGARVKRLLQTIRGEGAHEAQPHADIQGGRQ